MATLREEVEQTIDACEAELAQHPENSDAAFLAALLRRLLANAGETDVRKDVA